MLIMIPAFDQPPRTTGDGVRIATIGLDFVYGYPLGANGWTLLVVSE